MTLAATLAHPDVVRLTRALELTPGRVIEPDPPMRLAAIALVLRLGDVGEPELLMIKRAEFEGDPWSGQVACPGGRMEAGDRDLVQTAMRETWEETGIELARVGKLLGTLDDLSPRTPSLPAILVRPYVVAAPTEVEIVQSPEVAAAFWVPLSRLQAEAAWSVARITIRGFDRETSIFTHGEHTVWGLTERVLRQLLLRLA